LDQVDGVFLIVRNKEIALCWKKCWWKTTKHVN